MSWADDCNRYIQEKSFTAPSLQPVKHITRDKSNEWRSQQRAFNPILGKMIDGHKELARTTGEGMCSVTNRERAKEKALASTQHGYDIVTNRPRFGIPETTVSKMGGNQEQFGKRALPRDPNVGYDILTTEDIPKYSHITEPPERQKGMPKTKLTAPREFNVISHTFSSSDQEKKAGERSKTLDHARGIVKDRLHPILGEYQSVEKELAERAKRAAEEESQRRIVKERAFKPEGRLARREGHNYDIIRNEVFLPDAVRKMDDAERAPVASKAQLRQKWEWQRDVDEATDTVTRTRCLNRFNTSTRQKTAVAHGYDIVTTSEMPREKLEVLKKPSVMESLAVSSRTGHTMIPSASDVLHPDRTRTTHEKLFHAPPSQGTIRAHSFDGRARTIWDGAQASGGDNAAVARGPVRADPLKYGKN